MKENNMSIFKTRSGSAPVPFDSAEEVWFWFISAQQARNDGARTSANLSVIARPCEPSDILKCLERLHRNRRLTIDHLLVLRHYGRRQMAPEPRRAKEAKAFVLWHEALERLEDIFTVKGIIREQENFMWPPGNCYGHATIHTEGAKL